MTIGLDPAKLAHFTTTSTSSDMKIYWDDANNSREIALEEHAAFEDGYEQGERDARDDLMMEISDILMDLRQGRHRLAPRPGSKVTLNKINYGGVAIREPDATVKEVLLSSIHTILAMIREDYDI